MSAAYKGTWKKQSEKFGGGYSAVVYGKPEVGSTVKMFKKDGTADEYIITNVLKEFESRFENPFCEIGDPCAFCEVQRVKLEEPDENGDQQTKLDI
jgi:hypothetical protein